MTRKRLTSCWKWNGGTCRPNGTRNTGTSWRTSKLSRSISVNLKAASLDKQEIVSSLIETYRNIMRKWRIHNGGHGFFLSCHEFANYRISITRRVSFSFHTDGHGRSRIFLVTRLVLGPTDRREVIFELSNFCLPWPSAILRVIKRNSIIRKFGIKKKYRGEKKNIRDTPWHSVWYGQDIEKNDSVIFSDLGVKVSSLMVIGC